MSEDEKYSYHFNTSNAFSGALYQDVPRLMNLWQNGHSHRIKFVRYEDLVLNPHQILSDIYQFLELPLFEHDLYNIEQSRLYEHDHAYFREKTSHVVQSKIIEWQQPTRNLSIKFHEKVMNEHRWFYDGFYPTAS
jgi:hypothetical protein